MKIVIGKRYLWAILVFSLIIFNSCSKKTSCPAYDNFGADHKNMNEGDSQMPIMPKKSRKGKSKKNVERGLFSKKYKKTFKAYKPDKK